MDKKSNQTTLLVLLALAESPKHGYDISKFIENKSGGFFRLPFGSLYPVLHKLEKEGLIHAKWADEDTRKPRKVYNLTGKGRAFTGAETENFRAYSRALLNLIPAGVKL